MSAEKKYIFWLDFMRVVSIFFVIVIHASNPLYNRWKGAVTAEWLAGNVYNSIARVSVPLLFMISGYLLLSRKEELRPFFVNRLSKTALPLVIWSVVYLLWDNRGYPSFTFFNALKALVYAILRGPAYYHFWFMYVLLAIYLFVPVLRTFVHAADETTIRYFALAWFALGPLLDFVEQRLLNFQLGFDLKFFTGYIGYFYLGYVLGRFEYSRKISVLAGLVYAGLAAFTIRATTAGSLLINDYYDFYLNYLRLNIAVMSVCAFIGLKTLGEALGARAGQTAVASMRSLASASFGIYLMHAMLLWMFRNGTFGFDFAELPVSPFVLVPALSAVTFLACYLVTRVLQRIPYVRAAVPA